MPNWLVDSVMAWLTPHFVYRSGRESVYETEALRLLERRLRIQIQGDSGYQKWNSLAKALPTDGELFLDVLDFQLHRMDDDYYTGGSEESPEELERLLAEGGSAWMVVRREGSHALERRVPSELAQAMNLVATPTDNASAHLKQAWTKVYGRDPDPSGAYREAVRAVEAVAKPALLANDDRATLGKMIARLEQAPQRFSIALKPPDYNAPKGLIGMMKLLWKSQYDRHGTDEPVASLHVTLEEAEAALWLAIVLVQWFRSGAIREV